MTSRIDFASRIPKLLDGFTCGYCSRRTIFVIRFAEYSMPKSAYGDLWDGVAIAVVECSNCEMLTVVLFQVRVEELGISFDEEPMPYLAEHPEILDLRYEPEPWGGTVSPIWVELQGQYPCGLEPNSSVPEAIAKDLQEAGNCIAVGASNAAVIMCRRVVERLAAHFGNKPTSKQTLGATLEILRKKGIVDESTFEALSEIKEWGNITAHPEKDKSALSLSQAQKILQLVTHIVYEAFPRVDVSTTVNELRQIRSTRSSKLDKTE